MVVRYLPKKAGYQKESNFDKWPWDKKPWNLLTAYASTDTDCTFQLCTFFEKRLCGKYVEILEKSIKYFTGV